MAICSRQSIFFYQRHDPGAALPKGIPPVKQMVSLFIFILILLLEMVSQDTVKVKMEV